MSHPTDVAVPLLSASGREEPKDGDGSEPVGLDERPEEKEVEVVSLSALGHLGGGKTDGGGVGGDDPVGFEHSDRPADVDLEGVGREDELGDDGDQVEERSATRWKQGGWRGKDRPRSEAGRKGSDTLP